MCDMQICLMFLTARDCSYGEGYLLYTHKTLLFDHPVFPSTPRENEIKKNRIPLFPKCLHLSGAELRFSYLKVSTAHSRSLS